MIDSTDAPRGWRDAEPDLVVIAEAGGFSSTSAILLGRRSGTRIEDLPVVVIGRKPPLSPDQASEVDEQIAADVSDQILSERLRVWARWGRRARRLREAEAQVRDSQDHDALTGLLGHRAFQERLDAEFRRFQRYGTPLSLILGDVEGMRRVNDQVGPRTGDRVLREVGETLRRAVRDVDTVARYESDTFAILLPQSTALGTAKVVGRLQALVAGQILKGEAVGSAPAPLLKVTMLFGHASLPDERIHDRGGLLAEASAALEREKSARSPSAVHV